MASKWVTIFVKDAKWSWIIHVFNTLFKPIYRNKVINQCYLQHKGKFTEGFLRDLWVCGPSKCSICDWNILQIGELCQYWTGRKSGQFWSARLDRLKLIFTKVMSTSCQHREKIVAICRHEKTMPTAALVSSSIILPIMKSVCLNLDVYPLEDL